MIRISTSCNFYKTLAMAVIAILGVPLSAPAAWLGYRNDTKAVIVVQTSINVNGRIIHGKAHTLFPGEVAWDNIPAPGARQIVVADPKTNNRIVASEIINVQNQDVFLSAQMFQPPQIPGKAAVPPVVRIVGIKAPVAPGTTPQKPKTDPNPGPKTGQPSVPKGNLPPTVTPKTPEAPKGKSPAVPKGNLPPSVAPKPSEAPKGNPPVIPKGNLPPTGIPPSSKTPPKDAPKGSSAPVVPPKTKSG